MEKIKVSLIGHSYLEKRYRGKLDFLSRKVDLTVTVPHKFISAYGLFNRDFSENAFKVQVFKCIFPAFVKTSTRWILKSFDLNFTRLKPDVIQIENELSSFILIQSLLYRKWYAPDAKVVVFVWANQKLHGWRRFLDLISKWSINRIDHFICGNNDGKNLLINDFNVPKNKISVFPLIGIDTDFYSPIANQEVNDLKCKIFQESDTFVIGFMGRIVEEKGVMDLVEAFINLKKRTTKNIKLLFVGKGNMEHKIPVSDDIRIISPGDASAARQYLHAMDLLVLPSRTTLNWKEQFGNVLAEAMACGIPVIGSNSGAIPEVLNNSSLVFKEGVIEDLEDKIMNLMEDNLQYQRTRIFGLDLVKERYSTETVAERTFYLYKTLLGLNKDTINN